MPTNPAVLKQLLGGSPSILPPNHVSVLSKIAQGRVKPMTSDQRSMTPFGQRFEATAGSQRTMMSPYVDRMIQNAAPRANATNDAGGKLPYDPSIELHEGMQDRSVKQHYSDPYSDQRMAKNPEVVPRTPYNPNAVHGANTTVPDTLAKMGQGAANPEQNRLMQVIQGLMGEPGTIR